MSNNVNGLPLFNWGWCQSHCPIWNRAVLLHTKKPWCTNPSLSNKRTCDVSGQKFHSSQIGGNTSNFWASTNHSQAPAPAQAPAPVKKRTFGWSSSAELYRMVICQVALTESENRWSVRGKPPSYTSSRITVGTCNLFLWDVFWPQGFLLMEFRDSSEMLWIWQSPQSKQSKIVK